MTRKILFGATTLALLVAGFGVASFPALAELRIITITLEGGQEVVTTVDVPPGTPPEAIQLPEISAPVKKVQDGGPAQPTTPADETEAREAEGQDQGDLAGRVPRGGRAREAEAREAQEDEARRHPHSRRSSHPRQPDADARPPRPRAGRRPELRDQQVPHPAVPASDLPGRRHAVRHPLGGPRGDQRDRDRLRPQPERVVRRRARVDAVHPFVLARVRDRREPRRREGPVQPRRRDLRRGPLPEGRRRRGQPAPRDLRLQPRRLVRRLGDDARAADLRPARRPGRIAHRPDPGPLPGPRPAPATRTTSPSATCAGSAARSAARTTPPRSSTRTTAAARSTSTRAAAHR